MVNSDPKLATRTFQMFRCVDLGPRIGMLLEADFSKKCFEGVHAEYVPVAVASAIVYLLGVPLGTFVALFRNRKRLHAPEIESRYGDLYRQYEDGWYWWECALMVQKCMLTGAMCAIAPGSPLQLLIAMFVCMTYLLLVLHAGPFKGIIEDRLAFLVSLCLTVSLCLGFALITDNPARPVFDLTTLGALLIVSNVLPFAYAFWAAGLIVRFGPNYGIQAQGAATATGRNKGRAGRGRGADDKRSLRERSSSSRRLTVAHVQKAVLHEQLAVFEQRHEAQHLASLAAIREREKRADARVRERLAERRAKRAARAKNAGKASGASRRAGASKTAVLPVENDGAASLGSCVDSAVLPMAAAPVPTPESGGAAKKVEQQERAPAVAASVEEGVAAAPAAGGSKETNKTNTKKKKKKKKKQMK